jgi:phosphatidate cytidylyltransferase
MKLRIITGLIAGVTAIAIIFYAPRELMFLVVLACAIIGIFEFDRLFFPSHSPYRLARLVCAITITFYMMRGNPRDSWFTCWAVLILLCVIHFIRVYAGKDIKATVSQLSLEFLGYAYVVCLLGFLLPIASLGREFLLLLFLVVFGGDTVAYFVGSAFGKRPLAPRVSPKKSVEGAIAALLYSVAVTSLWSHFLKGEDSFHNFGLPLILFAPALSALAQVGDLFESLLKRSQDQKDSGTLLPGHGGILDRMDGLALSTPAFYSFVAYLLER